MFHSTLTNRMSAFLNLFEIGGIQRWLGEMMLGVFFSLENNQLPVNFVSVLLWGYISTFSALCYLQAINDFFDVEIDRSKLRFTRKYVGLSRKRLIIGEQISRFMASVSIVCLLMVSVSLAWLTSYHLFAVVLMIILLSTLYSAPPVRYKEIHPFSTLGEIIGNLLPFLAGYSIVSLIDWQALVIAAIPATAAANNRFRHERKMYDFDRRTGKETIAVVYGLKTSFILSRLCVWLNILEILVLTVLGWFSFRFLFLLLLYLFLAYALWFGHLPDTARKVFGISWGFIYSLALVIYFLS